MKQLIIFALCLGITSGAFAQTNTGGELFSSVRTDDSADAATGMTLDEMLAAAKDTPDAGLYYNIGITYLEQSEVGRGVLYLRRANLIAPRDKDIREALTVVRESLGLPDYLFQTSPLARFFLFPFTVLPLGLMGVLFAVVFILGSVMLSLALARLVKDREGSRKAGVILMVVGAVFLFAAGIRYRVVFSDTQAVAIADTLLMDAPSADASSGERLTKGSECRITDSAAGFFKIDAVDGSTGWVAQDDIDRIWP